MLVSKTIHTTPSIIHSSHTSAFIVPCEKSKIIILTSFIMKNIAVFQLHFRFVNLLHWFWVSKVSKSCGDIVLAVYCNKFVVFV